MWTGESRRLDILEIFLYVYDNYDMYSISTETTCIFLAVQPNSAANFYSLLLDLIDPEWGMCMHDFGRRVRQFFKFRGSTIFLSF
jgi:hypothetical protein